MGEAGLIFGNGVREPDAPKGDSSTLDNRQDNSGRLGVNPSCQK